MTKFIHTPDVLQGYRDNSKPKKETSVSYKEVKKYVVKNEEGVEIAKFTEERHAKDYVEIRIRLDKGKYDIIMETKQIRSGRV